MDIEKELKELLVQAAVDIHKTACTQDQADRVSDFNRIGDIASTQELLSYIRVVIKYMMFDLEATRRENLYLRNLLEDP